MSYRSELSEHALDLRRQARAVDFANDPEGIEKAEKLDRLAEVIEFLLSHPQELIANLDA